VVWLVEHLSALTHVDAAPQLACLERRRRIAALKAQQAQLSQEKREQELQLKRLLVSHSMMCAH
jgi:hypothetical protein